MISGLAARVSAGLFFRMAIFLALCMSFSWTLVWTQFPMVGESASAVFAFFAVALAVALAVAPTMVEPLLPMKAALN
jgi:hypothetical protein